MEEKQSLSSLFHATSPCNCILLTRLAQRNLNVHVSIDVALDTAFLATQVESQSLLTLTRHMQIPSMLHCMRKKSQKPSASRLMLTRVSSSKGKLRIHIFLIESAQNVCQMGEKSVNHSTIPSLIVSLGFAFDFQSETG